MDNWRRNQRISNHHQVGQWRSSSSSYNGKPPLDNRFPTVPLWEKQFAHQGIIASVIPSTGINHSVDEQTAFKLLELSCAIT